MRRLWPAMVMIAVMALALPVSAREPIGGESKIGENLGWATGPCPEIGWFGTLEISGSDGLDGTYGLDLSFPEDIPSSVFVDEWWYWSEYFTVRDEVFEVDDEGLLVDCEPGAVLLYGYDTGVGQPAGSFREVGFVIDAAGPFAEYDGASYTHDADFTAWTEAYLTDVGDPFPTAFEGTVTFE